MEPKVTYCTMIRAKDVSNTCGADGITRGEWFATTPLPTREETMQELKDQIRTAAAQAVYALQDGHELDVYSYLSIIMDLCSEKIDIDEMMQTTPLHPLGPKGWNHK